MDWNKEVTLLPYDPSLENLKCQNTYHKMWGGACAVTDFAILLGAAVPVDYAKYYRFLKNRPGKWYLSSFSKDNCIEYINHRNHAYKSNGDNRSICVRPAIMYSNIEEISPDRLWSEEGLYGIEYGEYPQYVVDINLAEILEANYLAGNVKETGKTYTTDTGSEEYSNFTPLIHPEYEFNGKKYVRTKYFNEERIELSNDKTYEKGDTVWVEVKPIKWIIFAEQSCIVAKDLLLSGLKIYNYDQNNVDFRKTGLYLYLNNYFVKDIVPSKQKKVALTRKK